MKPLSPEKIHNFLLNEHGVTQPNLLTDENIDNSSMKVGEDFEVVKDSSHLSGLDWRSVEDDIASPNDDSQPYEYNLSSFRQVLTAFPTEGIEFGCESHYFCLLTWFFLSVLHVYCDTEKSIRYCW